MARATIIGTPSSFRFAVVRMHHDGRRVELVDVQAAQDVRVRGVGCDEVDVC